MICSRVMPLTPFVSFPASVSNKHCTQQVEEWFVGWGQAEKQLAPCFSTFPVMWSLTQVALTIRFTSTSRHQQEPSPGTCGIPGAHSPSRRVEYHFPSITSDSASTCLNRSFCNCVLGSKKPDSDSGAGANEGGW